MTNMESGAVDLGAVEYRTGPSVLILADDEAAAGRARRTVEQAGARTSDVAPLAGGAQRIDAHIVADAILVELAGDPGPELEAVLARIEDEVCAGRCGGVVSAPLLLLDRIWARGLHPDIHLLCEPGEAERVAAVALAAKPRPLMLHDVNKGQATARLQQLSEEVQRIASMLAALSEDDAIVAAAAAAEEAEQEAQPPLDAGQIRAIIRARRLREQFFKRDLFADPAWDMLLDLMAARLEKRRVAVSSLCIAAAVPPTTALRWIKALCDQGLFVRGADPEDGRRVFIELSDEAARSLEAYLKAAQRISASVI